MDNRKIVEIVVDAFDRSDTETILQHVTDDIVWEMVGDNMIVGKENFHQALKNMEGMEMLGSIKRHILLDGDAAAVDGEMTYKDENEQAQSMHYCDLYELESGKIKKMISYTVSPKK